MTYAQNYRSCSDVQKRLVGTSARDKFGVVHPLSPEWEAGAGTGAGTGRGMVSSRTCLTRVAILALLSAAPELV